MAGQVLDALNQPLVVFVLLVGTGGFLIVGELQMIARELRRTAGEGGATGRATWVGSPGRGRRYRLTVLGAAGLLLVSAFGTTSASYSQQLSGGLHVDVAFPTITPGAAPTTAPTNTPAPTDTPAPTSKSTAAPTSKSTAAPTPVTSTPTMPILPTPVIACGTANGQWTCIWDNQAAMPDATPTWFENTGSGFQNVGPQFSALDATGGPYQAYLVVSQAGYRSAQSSTASMSTAAPTPTAAPTDTPTPAPTATPTDTPTA